MCKPISSTKRLSLSQMHISVSRSEENTSSLEDRLTSPERMEEAQLSQRVSRGRALFTHRTVSSEGLHSAQEALPTSGRVLTKEES